MRVLLLAALAATAYGDHHALTCDADCVGGVYTAVAAAQGTPIGATYQDGDMAVYAFALYKGYATSGVAGAEWVGAVVQALATEDVCNNDGKRDSMVSCFDAIDADGVTAINDWLALPAQADLKEGYEFVIGALANQLAPKSLLAKEFGGLDKTTFDAALKVYYIVGAFGTYIVPIIESVFTLQADKDACYTQLFTAVEYDAAVDGKKDLAYQIATKPEGTLFGADGLKNAACFGTADAPNAAADNWAAITLGDGTTATFTGVEELLAATDAGLAEGQAAVAAALEVADKEAKDTDKDASPAAALSALVAAVALML